MAFPNGQVWSARHAAMKFDAASDVTITTNANLSSFWGSGTACLNAKNVTITLPTVTADAVPMVGVDSGSFQNMGLERKPVGLTKLTATLVLDADEVFETEVLTAVTISSAVAAKRYQVDANQKDTAILVYMTSVAGTDQVAFGLARCIVGFGDIKVTSDGHVEQDIEAYCLPKDTYWEYYD